MKGIISLLVFLVATSSWADDADRDDAVQLASLDAPKSYEIVPMPDGSKVRVIIKDEDLVVPSRTVNIEFASKNLTTNQSICLFIRSDSGEYWPIPAHQMSPSLLPINQCAKAVVELYGEPPSDHFNISFFALDRRDHNRMRKWLLHEGDKGSFYMTNRAIDLGTIMVN